ncbi:MAG: cytochrome c peroxidase, partial [Bacteroidota bacterium]
ASCHVPEKGFADGLAKSVTFDQEGTLQRNAPTVVNSIYADRYFYDLKALDLSNQTDHVVFHADEFNSSYNEIMDKLRESEEYVELFKAAFPSTVHGPINKYNITTAITAYTKTLSGFDSPFDQYARGETDQIDPAVVRGFNLFMGKAACGTCHFAPTFSGLVPPVFHESESEVLGVAIDHDTLNPVLDPDMGRFVNGNLKEKADHFQNSFKTVSVRNVALTAPYMHNGAYETLEEVVEFYNVGGGAGMGLDLPYQTLAPDHLNLTSSEQKDIIAFMEALTDTTGLTTRPTRLPEFPGKPEWNARKIGGEY